MYLRSLDAVEAAMRGSAGDAASEIRQVARRMYTRYCYLQPDRAAQFLRRLEPVVQERLLLSIDAAKKGVGGPVQAQS